MLKLVAHLIGDDCMWILILHEDKRLPFSIVLAYPWKEFELQKGGKAFLQVKNHFFKPFWALLIQECILNCLSWLISWKTYFLHWTFMHLVLLLLILYNFSLPTCIHQSSKETSFTKFRRWWKGVNLFEKAYILLPIHDQ